MKKFYFIRHPQTKRNVELKLQGMVESPLTEWGKESTKAFVRKFNPIESIDVIYYACNFRTEYLALHLYRKLKRTNPKIEILQDEHLNERNFGTLEGVTHKKAKQLAGYESDDMGIRYRWRPPEGSSYEDTFPTVKEFLNDLKNGPFTNGICVTSSAIIKLALYLYGYWDIGEMMKSSSRVPNLGLYEIIFQ